MKFLRTLRAFSINGGVRVRFSQYGEDTIIRKTFSKNEGFYIDVGAHHPFRQSNTAYLWCLGWNGVNVDANAESIKLFRRIRPKDVNIWSAVVSEETAKNNKTVDLYSSKKLDLSATISPNLADERSASKVHSVPCTYLKKIIEDYSPKDGRGIDFLNIDIEGLDETAVEDIALWPTLPKMIATETYANSIPETIKTRTFKLLSDAGYDYRYQIGLTSIYVLA